MKSFKLLDQQSRRVFTAIAVLVATIAPALSPVLVSAAQLTTRSITLSSSTVSDTGVSYKVQFTTVNATSAGAFAIDFCNNSPLVGDSCTAPTGFNASSAASTTSNFTTVTGSTSRIVVTAGTAVTTGSNVSVDITGINNPTVTGPLYARIMTYDTAAHATADSTEAGTGLLDSGAVALDITNNVSVNAAVLESLTFCVAGATITADCANASSNLPSLTLGQNVGGTVALVAGTISTGSVYTQLSTNAVGGAVVNIKSANACGGLKRVDASGCDIPATNLTNLTTTAAGIGVQVGSANGTATSGVTTANGVLQPTGSYSTSAYALTYSGANTGVTSTYGDPILTTNNTTADNMNNTLQFGAGITNQTPAGKYSNQYSLIATGKF